MHSRDDQRGASAASVGLTHVIGVRMDGLPAPLVWSVAIRLSVGAFFEVFEVALTGLLSPLLKQAGIFHDEAGLLGLPDLATFAFATFGGLFSGVIIFGMVADRSGRKPLLVLAPAVYGFASLGAATSATLPVLCAWRFMTAVGLGAEVVAVDAYLAELMPKATRGRGFAISKAIQYAAVPVATVLAMLCTRGSLAGIAAWRLLLCVPTFGAVLTIYVRRKLPESPRWLAEHGRVAEARQVLVRWRRRERNAEPFLTAPALPLLLGQRTSLLNRALRGRLAMMIVASCASTVAYHGFATWLPSTIEAQGVTAMKSLGYTAVIALAYPATPLLLATVADRIERRTQVICGAGMSAAAGIAFALQSSPEGWMLCGLAVVVGNNVMASGSHTYRSELFPTSLRGRAIGLIYSLDRLTAAFSSILLGWLLIFVGPRGVLTTLAAAALLDIAAIGLWGPRTLGLSSEEIGNARSGGLAGVGGRS